MGNNAIEEKSFAFAKEIVQANRKLVDEQREYVLSKQLLRAGTSIGANVSEAHYAQSRADFISKLRIAQKEAAETQYWIRLLSETGYLNEKDGVRLRDHAEELLRILSSICKSASGL